MQLKWTVIVNTTQKVTETSNKNQTHYSPKRGLSDCPKISVIIPTRKYKNSLPKSRCKSNFLNISQFFFTERDKITRKESYHLVLSTLFAIASFYSTEVLKNNKEQCSS